MYILACAHVHARVMKLKTARCLRSPLLVLVFSLVLNYTCGSKYCHKYSVFNVNRCALCVPVR